MAVNIITILRLPLLCVAGYCTDQIASGTVEQEQAVGGREL